MTSTIYTHSKRTTKQFIKESKEIHGNRYDYSKVSYTNRNKSVEIICPTHGSFLQPAKSHLIGRGCHTCAILNNSQSRRKDINHFIEKSKVIHGNKYDYSKSLYTTSKNRIEIICPTHGSFLQSPSSHMKGHGCRKCGYDNHVYSKYMNHDSHDANDICYLYNIKLTSNDEEFYKWGISNNYIKRHHNMSTATGYHIELMSILVDTRYNCWKIENKLISSNRRRGLSYSPLISFAGETECYIEN